MKKKDIINGVVVEQIDEDVLRYEVPKDGIITLEVITRLWENGNEWFPIKKRRLMGVFNSNFNPTKEAADFMVSLKRSEKIIAEAFCIDSPFLRFKANFYLKVKKPSIKTRIFDNEKEALKWLKAQ